MHTKNTPSDYDAQWQVIKGLIKIFPGGLIPIFFINLLIEAVEAADLSGLVIPAS